MNILIILGHPDPHSFNHAIAKTAEATLLERGHGVVLHDLYREQFDPLLEANEIPQTASIPQGIAKQCRELQAADGVVIVHPNWWGQPPAILKGWIDRVVRPGVAYRFRENDSGEGIPVGLLKARAAVVFNTSNTMPEREKRTFGDPLEPLWRNCVFGLCGVDVFHRRTFGIVVTSTESQRKQWLDEVKETMDRFFPKEPEREV
jgi:NAD(P)H dehydrogenase (quinone)